MYGGFEVIDEIGRGGMGVVYRARQTSLNRTVALKVLPPHNHDETAAARFEREAHAMAQLLHPNIVDVIEVGEEDDVPYFAMHYIEGEGLDQIIQREGALSPERAAEIAAQVADGLQHAHERGVIHRDIKPSNILISEDGRPVVTDFGIAKAMEGVPDGQSLTQGAIGTPEYMSPEVIKGNPVDGRTDVYSLGIVLYHVVTGRAPFTATTPYQIADRHLREAPPPPSSIGANCPDWLESIILRALAKEPTERFGSAAEMASALRTARPVAPPTREFTPAPSPSPEPARTAVSDQPARSANYRKVILAVGAAGILLLIGAVGLWMQTRGTDVPPVPPPDPPALETEVPSVVGLRQEEAEQRLKDTGNFLVQYNDSRYSDAYEAGRGISQHPESGTTIERGDLVTIVVSKGPEPHDPQIAPWTSRRRVTSSDLHSKSNWTLTLMRNEIYARHGRAFVTDAIRAYFKQQSWYSTDPTYSDTQLSEMEDKNAHFIREYQLNRFGRTAIHP